MFGIVHFETFLLAGILLNLTPGADTMYILSRSIANGQQAGILSALGISTGSLVHTVFAALGLSVLLAESQFAFNLVKYVGAAYLFVLGVKALLYKSPATFGIQAGPSIVRPYRIYVSGILTNVLNPKVALFYLAFLPQFIDPAAPRHFVSFLVLGGVFTTTGTIWCVLLAIYSSRLSDHIRRNHRVKIWLDRGIGAVFIALGIRLALSRK